MDQILNEAGESSEDFSDGEGEYEDGQERSNHSSNSAYGHEYDIGSNSSQSEKEEGKQYSDDLWTWKAKVQETHNRQFSGLL